MPTSAKYGESTCSKRAEASVRSLRSCEPRLIVTPSKVAASSKMSVVFSSMRSASPPLMPAMPAGLSSVVITKSFGLSSYTFLSRASSFSPSRAARTPMFKEPRRFASKACNGCPTLNITRLVASTTLLILLWPMASSEVLSHSGEGPTFTPLMSPAI